MCLFICIFMKLLYLFFFFFLLNLLSFFFLYFNFVIIMGLIKEGLDGVYWLENNGHF